MLQQPNSIKNQFHGGPIFTFQAQIVKLWWKDAQLISALMEAFVTGITRVSTVNAAMGSGWATQTVH